MYFISVSFNVHFFCLFTAAVMKNTGVLFANDINADRIKAVVGNFHRLGVVNSVVSSCDARKFSVVSLWYMITSIFFVCVCY
jgi:16S rRNA C967 or C1407 C5-methylase (RsmB/RsmF family)